MMEIHFAPETKCIMIKDQNNNLVDCTFINQFSYENGSAQLSDEINSLLMKNDIQDYSINQMLNTHLEMMINEYREIGYFTETSVQYLKQISNFAEYDEFNEICKFISMYENISDNAGFPVIKKLWDNLN